MSFIFQYCIFSVFCNVTVNWLCVTNCQAYGSAAVITVVISSTDWFDEIRTHPYTRNIIEKVTTIDPTDYLLSPSEMHAKLLSLVETVDNKMWQIMQHPEFLSARDYLHSSIRSVSCAFICYAYLCFSRRGFYINLTNDDE